MNFEVCSAIPRLAPWHVDFQSQLGYERVPGRITKKLRTFELIRRLRRSAQDAALESVSQVHRSSQSKKVLKKGCPEQVSEKGCILLLWT